MTILEVLVTCPCCALSFSAAEGLGIRRCPHCGCEWREIPQ
jgi:hypothetical protein